ncbi:Coq7 family protein [Parvularcula bermudensis HTCC2503]|uniref:3-demethoxyubiquinol 3-hydroxylase n=1 Tax=Parvularcula bermudensis (strain ATCC BAA-594 / HTCC2503 / KCTC 12087) TaxID=314260 RepID=E0TD93_PARBH|nr:demethoxyubiquinone hydroxylase family protein [Parvularcula bermudensis]ADM09916.1 Coq7 family protein [Parvularcula bermudensis HTCC2503]
MTEAPPLPAPTDTAEALEERKAPPSPGPKTRRRAEMLRVDHAGEYGAVNIYRGQRAVFEKVKGKAQLKATLAHMEDGEAHHLATFDRYLTEENIRPTLFSPVWNAAGFTLGAVTALMGEKAAMACTSAVETEIERHYGAQIDELDGLDATLQETVEAFRIDEIGHRDTALDAGAEETFGYSVMKRVIGFGCRAAISLAEKV